MLHVFGVVLKVGGMWNMQRGIAVSVIAYWMCIVCLALCVLAGIGACAGQDNQYTECEKYRARQILYVNDLKALREIHIRHNLRVGWIIHIVLINPCIIPARDS